MRIYQIVWLSCCASLIVVGASAVVVLAPAALAPWVALFAAAGAVLSLLGAGWCGQPPLRCRLRFAIGSALIGAATTCAVGGFAVLWGAHVLLLMLIVVFSCPGFVGGYVRWLNTPASPPATQIDSWSRVVECRSSQQYVPAAQPDASPELELELELCDLTNLELCRAWRASHGVLTSPASVAQLMATVTERQQYLDEFERRNSSGFAAWLSSDVESLGNPLPFLIFTRNGLPTIDWDDLTRMRD